jgi:hypothetical protein
VLDAVEQIDLSGVYGVYRADDWGRAAFDPQMMVALLLYADTFPNTALIDVWTPERARRRPPGGAREAARRTPANVTGRNIPARSPCQ